MAVDWIEHTSATHLHHMLYSHILFCDPGLQIVALGIAMFKLLLRVNIFLGITYLSPDIWVNKPTRRLTMWELLELHIYPDVHVNIKIENAFCAELQQHNCIHRGIASQLHLQHLILLLIIMLDSSYNTGFTMFYCSPSMILGFLIYNIFQLSDQ